MKDYEREKRIDMLTPEEIIRQRIDQQNDASAAQARHDAVEIDGLWQKIHVIRDEFITELNRLAWPDGYLYEGRAMHTVRPGHGLTISASGTLYGRYQSSDDGSFSKPNTRITKKDVSSPDRARDILETLTAGLRLLRNR